MTTYCYKPYLKSHHQTGFSLVELMVTISIIVIIAGLAIPSFAQSLANKNIDNTASQIANILYEAKIESSLRKNTVRITYDANTQVFTLSAPNPAATNFAAPGFITFATYALSSNSDIIINPARRINIAVRDGDRLMDFAGQPITRVVYTVCDKGTTNDRPKQVTVNNLVKITTTNAGIC